MTSHYPPALLPASGEADFKDWMAKGSELHEAGQLEHALLAFEHAHALSPHDKNAASAFATLLTALGRPAAAYRVLVSVEASLMGDADGATNLAIAATSQHDMVKAAQAYERALELDPGHLRALNNVGLLAAQQSQWPMAIAHARKCVELCPAEAGYRHNLAEYLSGSRLYAEALQVVKAAIEDFPEESGFIARHITLLALMGDFGSAGSLADTLDAARKVQLVEFFRRAASTRSPEELLIPPPATPPDSFQLYTSRAFEAMTLCDWRGNKVLATHLRAAIAEAVRTGQCRDWRDAQFYGHMLGLDESELAQMRNLSIKAISSKLKPELAPFIHQKQAGKSSNRRITVGLAVESLQDLRYLESLKHRLTLHDPERFALHIYSPTPRPLQAQADVIRPHAASIVETAHMSHEEVAGRMRLDQLDIFVDMTFNSPWCRPEVPALRVAPVQIRQLTWHRHHPPVPCDYNMSDTFVHPHGLDMSSYGPIVRLPHTCWLTAHGDAGDADDASAGMTREEAGLPDDALILRGAAQAVTLNPVTFSAWMKILRSLPDAVLWLPAYGVATAENLMREARLAGVKPGRLLFATPMTHNRQLAAIRHADLMLDAFHFNASGSLVEALKAGVPCLSCAGESMASRLGGSILRAAGLPELITSTAQDYVAEAVRLGRHPQALAALRDRVKASHATAPLFDQVSRLREWEAAWTIMTERSRSGLPPAAFDVPVFNASAAH